MGGLEEGVEMRRDFGCAVPDRFVLLTTNLLVQIHFVIVMIRWTGLAPWGFEFIFPGSLHPHTATGDLFVGF